jgi:hypothetical protein
VHRLAWAACVLALEDFVLKGFVVGVFVKETELI